MTVFHLWGWKMGCGGKRYFVFRGKLLRPPTRSQFGGYVVVRADHFSLTRRSGHTRPESSFLSLPLLSFAFCQKLIFSSEIETARQHGGGGAGGSLCKIHYLSPDPEAVYRFYGFPYCIFI